MNKYIMLAVSLLAAMCGAAGCRTRAPLMVAHRGAGDLEMPEASLAAYSNAVATACDIVKLDLLETKDGVVVMGHDLEAIPSTVKAIAVLDRTKEPGSLAEPLFLDVAAAYVGKNAPKLIGYKFQCR